MDNFTSDSSPIPTATDGIQATIDEAYELFRTEDGGEVSDLYAPLAAADPSIFGLSFVTTSGDQYSAGYSSVRFVLMSVSKPFVFALVCDLIGVNAAHDRLGANATGLAFNSLEAVERNSGKTNPMVNSGAIATVGLYGDDPWPRVLEGLSRFAGAELKLDDEIFGIVSATNKNNRALTQALDSFSMLEREPADVLDAYTRQCCVSVNSSELAVMGATLANGGINPLSGQHVVSAEASSAALSVMATAGLYETSGDWLYRVQLPGKSGVSGGIFGASPAKGAFATYSPRIDSAANSVRGQLAAEFLSDRLDLGVLG